MKSIEIIIIGLVLLPLMGLRAQSVLANGDFEWADSAQPAKPAHWDAVDGLAVQWTQAAEAGLGPSHGKAIRMDTSLSEKVVVASNTQAGLTQWVFPKPGDGAIAGSYGLSLYSEAMPIATGKAYRVTFDFMSERATAGKLWFRAYARVNGEKKRVYEGQVDCAGEANWKTFSGSFHPTKYRADATEFKVMLFAYFPPGVAWFDNVKVEALDEVAVPIEKGASEK